MPLERPAPGSSRDWLLRANGDLALARAPLPEGGFYEDLCFHAQQAAEKAIKAVYIHLGLPFRYTHDLDDLGTGLREKGVEIPKAVEDAVVLTGFAWETRYPGFMESVTSDERASAVKQAEAVLTWAARIIEGK